MFNFDKIKIYFSFVGDYKIKSLKDYIILKHVKIFS